MTVGMWHKRGIWIAWAALLAGFVLISATQWGDPSIEDEILIHEGARIWFHKGADWFELAHTPLYLEALSFWQKVWGEAVTPAPLRAFGTFCGLLTLLLFAWGLMRESFDRWAVLAATALLAFHPYFLQGTLLLDYDVTVQGPPLLLWVILAQKWDRIERPGWLWAVGLGLVFGAALFAKELTPLILVPLWPFWAWLRKYRWPEQKKNHRHIAQSCAGLCVGFAFAFVLLVAWADLRGFHWSDPLRLSLSKTQGRGDVSGFFPWDRWGWGRFMLLSYLPWLWVGVPLVLAGLWRFRSSILGGITPRAWLSIPLPVLFGTAIFAAYTWIVQASFYFPKYTHPGWVIFFYGICVWALPKVGPEKALKMDKTSLQSSSAKLAFYCAALFALGWFGDRMDSWAGPWGDPVMLTEFRRDLSPSVIVAHFAAIACPLWLLLKAPLWAPVVGRGALALVLFFYFLGTDFRHANARYETRYLYGERGFSEALAQVRAFYGLHERPVASAARDLVWAAGRDQARLFLVPGNDFLPDPRQFPVWVSRDYGEYSVFSSPGLRARLDALYPCKKSSGRAAESRYSWWWVSTSGQCG